MKFVGEIRRLRGVGNPSAASDSRSWLWAVVALGAMVCALWGASTASAAPFVQETVLRGYGTDNLHVLSSTTGVARKTNYGIHPGTSPSVAELSTGGYVAAFRGYGTSNLFVFSWPGDTAIDTKQGISPETSPSIAAVPIANAYRVAFRGYGTDNLYIYDSRTGVSTNTNQGIHPGTSPSIAAIPNSNYFLVAFRGYGTNNVYIYDSRTGVSTNTNQGIHPGTSPSIAVMGDGSYRVAFRGYGTSNLFVYNSQTGVSTNTNQGIHPETSPSIAAAPEGYYVAFRGYGSQNLYSYSSSTGVSTATPFGLADGTSPGTAISPYWTSRTYGGADGSVNTAAEVSTLLDAMSANDGAKANELSAGLTPGDRVYFAQHLPQGALVQEKDGGKAFYINNGTRHWIPNPEIATIAGFDLRTVKTVGVGILANTPQGIDYYPTSWQFGGADHSISIEETGPVLNELALANEAARTNLYTGMLPGNRVVVEEGADLSTLVLGSPGDTYTLTTPTSAQLEDLELTPTEAGTATAAGVGPFCKSPIQSSAPIEWWEDPPLLPAFKIATVGKATFTGGFCYSRSKHTAAWDRYQYDIDPRINGIYTASWKAGVDPGAPMPFSTWNYAEPPPVNIASYPKGAVVMEKYYHTEMCGIKKTSPVCKRFNFALGIKGRFDGTWEKIYHSR